jgi:hypothetical protein
MTERDPAARPSASQLVGAVDALIEQDDLLTLGHAASDVSVTVLTEPMDVPTGIMTRRIETTDATGSPAESEGPPPATTRSPWRRFTVVLAALLVAAGLTGGAVAWTSLSGRPHPSKHPTTPTVVVTVKPTPTIIEVPAPSNTGGDQQGNGSETGNGAGSGTGGGNGNSGNGNSGNGSNHGNSGH